MAKKKELLSKAPWRGDDDDSDKFSGAKLKVTKESDGMSKMHVPSRGTDKGSLADDDDSLEIDPQLRYSFNRNYQVSLFKKIPLLVLLRIAFRLLVKI